MRCHEKNEGKKKKKKKRSGQPAIEMVERS